MKKSFVLLASVGMVMSSGLVYAGGAGCIYSQQGEIAKLAPDPNLIPDDVLATEMTDEQYALYLKEQQALVKELGGKPIHN